MPPAFQQIAADVKLGQRVSIYGFANLYGCEIGDDTKIGAFVEIQRGAKVGKRCKISSHTFICEGVTLEDEVFIGHNVTFINDAYPRAATADGQLQTEQDWVCVPTRIKHGASIGSSATLLCGITVGEHAMVGAGSVVTKDVPPYTVVAGNPSRVLRTLPNPNSPLPAPCSSLPVVESSSLPPSAMDAPRSLQLNVESLTFNVERSPFPPSPLQAPCSPLQAHCNPQPSTMLP